MTTKYNVRYVHKIAPKATDGDTFEHATDVDQIDVTCKSIGKVLRDAGVLMSGQRLRSVHLEVGRIIAFPCASIWHSFIITKRTSRPTICFRCSLTASRTWATATALMTQSPQL